MTENNPVDLMQNISEQSLEQLLSSSLYSTPSVSIESGNKIWVATAMLIHYLESFTDSLVVTKGNEPCGVLGGIEILENVMKSPSSELFDNNLVEELMNPKLSLISKDITLGSLAKEWQKSSRAFSVIPNKMGCYSAISVRKILEVVMRYNTGKKISDLPSKKVVTFNSNDTIGKILNLMFENKTRKLIFENSSQFVSDRIIIGIIAQDKNYLRGVDDFLEQKINPSRLADAKEISQDLKIHEVSKIMFGMLHPYIIYKDGVITPWDLCMTLVS